MNVNPRSAVTIGLASATVIGLAAMLWLERSETGDAGRGSSAQARSGFPAATPQNAGSAPAAQASHSREQIVGASQASSGAEASREVGRSLLERWQEIDPQELERLLRALFATDPELATAVATQIFEEAIVQGSKDRANHMRKLMLELAEPSSSATQLIGVFRNVQARSGTNEGLYGRGMSAAQMFALTLQNLSAERRQAWVDALLRAAPTQETGADMFVILVAATASDHVEAIPRVQQILADSHDDLIQEMALVNLGRLADAETLVAIATQAGVHLAKPPRSERDIQMQGGLASGMVNALNRDPRAGASVAREMQPLLENWARDERCHLLLEHTLKSLAPHPIPGLRASLETLAASPVPRIATAASQTLQRWKF